MGRRRTIGEVELEILRFVTDHPSITVREAAEHFAAAKGLARTTVQTVLERLRRKAYVTREQVEGVYRYGPRESGAELVRRLVRDFVATALGGSPSPFVAYLVDEAPLSQQDVQELRRLVDDLDRGQEGTQ